MRDDLTKELLSVAHQLADAAARETLPLFRAISLATDDKDAGAGFDPVTEADRAAERAIRAELAVLRPDDGILGEEEAEVSGSSGLTWVIDPIDGTRAFISGLPVWGTLIAVSDNTGPILGLVDQPYIGERFVGAPDQAVLRRSGAETSINVRSCAALSGATVFTTFPEVGTEAERQAFQAVSSNCRLTRYGTDCYAYCLLAMGQIDLVIEAGLKPYDIQGPLAVVSAAGGVITNWTDGPAWPGGRVIAAGDPRVHKAALEYLSDVPD